MRCPVQQQQVMQSACFASQSHAAPVIWLGRVSCSYVPAAGEAQLFEALALQLCRKDTQLLVRGCIASAVQIRVTTTNKLN